MSAPCSGGLSAILLAQSIVPKVALPISQHFIDKSKRPLHESIRWESMGGSFLNARGCTASGLQAIRGPGCSTCQQHARAALAVKCHIQERSAVDALIAVRTLPDAGVHTALDLAAAWMLSAAWCLIQSGPATAV
eukprot:1160355-Pelagomonas_calceolata.AAC.8